MSPAWKSVSGCRLPRPAAMRPNWASTPVAYTTPTPSPALTMVPMNARSVESVRPAWPLTGRGDFSDAVELAGQDAFVAFQSVDVDQPDVGTPRFAERQSDHIAGHQVGDIDLGELPVAAPHRGVVHRRMQHAAEAESSARYWLDRNPSRCWPPRITPMMIACLLSPRKKRNRRRCPPTGWHRVARLGTQHRDRVHPMVRTT